MITLPLTLKKQWFDMILSGEKKEEYRAINDYWARRLLYIREEIEWQVWEEMLDDMKDPYFRHSGPADLLSFFGVQFRGWQAIRFVNGYGKSRPSFCIEIASLTINRGFVGWGAVDGEYYFTFQLGKVLEC